MAYEVFKDFERRTAAYKVLKDKVFNIAKNSKYDRNQRDLASMVYKFFNKKSKTVVVLIKKLNEVNNQLKNCIHQLSKSFKKEQFIFI